MNGNPMRSLVPCLLLSTLMVAQAPERTSAKEILQVLTMRPKAMDVRPSIDLQVTFAFNSSALTAEGRAQLDELARALQAPELAAKRIGLYGHTDGVGRPEYNQKLSERRAETVRRYLIDRFGLGAARLQAKGFGATKLLLPDEPKADANRRVEVEVLD